MAIDLDDFKDKWKNVNLRLERLEENNERLAARLATTRATTAQQKLANTVLLSGIIAFLLPVLAPLLVSVLSLPQWVGIVYGAYGVIMGIVNICASKYISRYDYLSMPVVDGLKHAIKIQRLQRNSRLAGIFFGAILIFLLAFYLFRHEDPYIMVSFGIGLTLGLAIGIIKSLKMYRLTKQIQDELRSIQEDKSF